MFLVLVELTTPTGVEFEDHLDSICKPVRASIVMLHDNSLSPAAFREIMRGPICAFDPGSVLCNVTSTMIKQALEKAGYDIL